MMMTFPAAGCVSAGVTILGYSWVDWLRQAVVGVPPVGSLAHYGFSVGVLLVGSGGADWHVGTAVGPWFRRAFPDPSERP